MTMLLGKYLGRKGGSGVAQWIINKMPKHDVYIEPFCGCAVVASLKKLAMVDNVLIDVNSGIIDELKQHSFSKDFTLICDDSLAIIDRLISDYIGQGKKVLIYLDPPYLPETRSSFSSCQYSYELTILQHSWLLSFMKDKLLQFPKNLYFMISGYKSDMYMSMLECFFYFDFQTMSRGGIRTESLWTSFNPDDYVKHQYDYVGSTFTDRQRIKRKSSRWVSKFQKLSFDEQMVIFEDLKKVLIGLAFLFSSCIS